MSEQRFAMPDTGGGTRQERISFRDKLIGAKVALPRRERMDLIAHKLFRIELDHGDRLKPRCYIDDGILAELWKPWQEAIIVTLLGKNIGYLAMRDRLRAVWKFVGDMDIVDIGNGFFMVKFDSAIDREKVFSDGPWMIFDHYVAVRPWMPDFISSEMKINKLLVWVRFPGLGMEYYDESVLLALASAVGNPVKVDIRTIDASRGKFARVCVEIDLEQPVVGKVWFRNNWFNVQYEGLHLLCRRCGMYGHLSRKCDKGASAEGSGGVETATLCTTGNESGPTPNGTVTVSLSANHADGIRNGKSGTPEDLHHDWLAVEKRRKPRNQVPKIKGVMDGPNSNNKSKNMERNKFGILNSFAVEDNDIGNKSKGPLVEDNDNGNKSKGPLVKEAVFTIGESSKMGEKIWKKKKHACKEGEVNKNMQALQLAPCVQVSGTMDPPHDRVGIMLKQASSGSTMKNNGGENNNKIHELVCKQGGVGSKNNVPKISLLDQAAHPSIQQPFQVEQTHAFVSDEQIQDSVTSNASCPSRAVPASSSEASQTSVVEIPSTAVLASQGTGVVRSERRKGITNQGVTSVVELEQVSYEDDNVCFRGAGRGPVTTVHGRLITNAQDGPLLSHSSASTSGKVISPADYARRRNQSYMRHPQPVLFKKSARLLVGLNPK